ncbi:bifunctional diguanylate cyclase/phosphodiesterase [Pseudomonas neustonica]|uniref:Bifunctional diguanylate cyclase/phosphodiesterase n=2 Tax=Pseudomonas TaxID=286 RepID=A0ABX9XN53_9PSED|nr:bifunctional diguanylate cyclase/phosphodiesterase [Pseudomonas sp. SSM44]ROZ88491.1 bifunctional diguanylate cyclase/phosphodiesterase [Pseudomonas neustonica]|tara:strand:- start:6962 stop:9328 length:2367 start_codon:yes stop_codon:yes gene_type:complete
MPMLPVKPAIMLLLSLLVGIFMFGTWLMSSLNLNYSQSAMAELRQRQITDTFYANLDRINAHHRQMEHNTQGLARMGSLLDSLQSSPSLTTQRLRQSLQQTLTDFPDSYGGSVWFANDRADRALYAYRQENNIQVESIPAGEREMIAQWFARLANQYQSGDLPDPADSWMPAYYKASIESAVISHAALITNSQQQPIGLAITDWRAEDIVRTVSRVEVTPGTFSFLLDTENRNLSSLAEADNVAKAQELINAIIDLNLYEQVTPQTSAQIVSTRQLASPLQQLRINLDQREFALFFSRTQAGMMFGIGVPQAEIDAVLEPMRKSNFKIVSLTALILLIISALILYLVAGILRQLHNLYTDSLTDLPNRERLIVDLKKRRTASLILLNLDSFKEINDVYGHECGDHVIAELAHSLDHYLADEPDWQQSRLYRMPADELAIWLPGQQSEDSLRPQLNNLLEFISALKISWQNQDIPVNASLGAASSAQRGSDEINGESLLPGANIALELARLNKDNYVIYDERHKIRESYEQNLIWANRLKGALGSGRIVPFFQPIMDLKTNRIDKFECLVRLLDEQGEPIGPIHFLDLAKKVRLYRSITRCMVESSMRQFADLPYTFSLNLSCEDLLDQALSDHIIAMVEEYQIGSRVIFEILESEGIENYAEVRQFIDRAKTLGCRIAIDDFGTGYSNFEHLLRLDVDLIKIDGSLIKQLDTNPTAMTICNGIVHFAEELGMQTVAEFVHSPAILAKVKELGINFAQGAAIGMPSASLITKVTMTGTEVSPGSDSPNP